MHSYQIRAVSPDAQLTVPEPRYDAKGKYVSLYRVDVAFAEWAQKTMGGAAGAAPGNLAKDKLHEVASKS